MFGPTRMYIKYTPDLPEFLERELIRPAELARSKREEKEKRKAHILKNLKEGEAYLDLSPSKFRMMQIYPYVIGRHDYIFEKDQVMPVYDSEKFRVGDGFALEIEQMEDINMDNVFQVYEEEINRVAKFEKNEKGGGEWKYGTRKNHIYPVPKNPILKYLMARRLVEEYVDNNPFSKRKYVEWGWRKTKKMGEFVAVYTGEKEDEKNYFHFLVPRKLCHPVIEDNMWGDNGPFTEVNIVPQLTFPAGGLMSYPMIDFEHPSFFREYPKGLAGKEMREIEVLEEKLGHLSCAVYNQMDRNGVIDEMRSSIHDKYEQIGAAQRR